MARPKQARPRTIDRVAVAVTCVVFLTALAFVLLVRRDRSVDTPLRGTPLSPSNIAADFVLTGTRDAPVHLIEPGFRTTFLFFGYTHCPDECPLALASLGRAYRSLRPAERRRTRVVFVSVDPARDTPAVMRRYLAAFDPGIAGLTGSTALLRRVTEAYGVRVDRKSHDISHGGAIYAVDASDRVVLEYPSDAPASDLAADAATLANR